MGIIIFQSDLRHDLFNLYPFKDNGKLLEMGSGYDQLTSLFTEKVKEVTAIEDLNLKKK